jgi:hypothetical protein
LFHPRLRKVAAYVRLSNVHTASIRSGRPALPGTGMGATGANPASYRLG